MATRTGRHSVLSNMLMLVGGTGASQVLLALAAPLLTRIYAPSAFGAYAVALAVFNLLSSVVCLRYETAIALPRTSRAAANIVALCIVISIAMSTIAVVICLAGIAIHPVRNALEWWAVLLLPLGVLFCGLQQIIRFWCIRMRHFPTITLIVLTQTLVTLGTQVLAGVLISGSAIYLLLGTVLGFTISVLVAVPMIARVFPASLIGGVRISRMKAAALRHKYFPLFASPYGFISQAAGRILLIILAAFVTTAVIGQFALAQRVVYLPVVVLTSSLSQVFYSRAIGRLEDPRLHKFVSRIMMAGVLVFAPFLALNFQFSEQIFAFAFGARWLMAGTLAKYIGISSGIVALTAWLDRIYDIRSRQPLALLLELVNDIAALGTLTLVMYATHDVTKGIMGFALATVAFYTLWTYVTIRIAPFPDQVFGRFVGTMAAATGYVVLSGLLATFLTSNHLAQALIFAALNAPVLVLGIKIGRNSLGERATTLSTFQI